MRGTLARAGAYLLVASLSMASAGCQDSDPRPPASSASESVAAATTSPSPAARTTDPALLGAVQSYQAYLATQAETCVTRTRQFTDAIRANDLALAKKQFAPSRTGWERILWVAFLAPDLDRRLDARADEFASPADPAWTGWHRLEYLLWVKGDTAAARALANRLDRDVNQLRPTVVALRVTPKDITTGAQRLVEDAATDKLTGGEDPYSHTDLWDFVANMEGAGAAYSTVRTALNARDPGLARRVDQQFSAVTRILATYRTGAGYRPYPAVTATAKAGLQARLEALAEDLSAVVSAFEQ